MVYAGIVYIVLGKMNLLIAWISHIKVFASKTLLFAFSRKKKKLYLGIFVFPL